MGIQVNQAAPGSSGGGSNGTFPAISTSTWLLLIGGLLGFVTPLALLTITARANSQHTKRRPNRVSIPASHSQPIAEPTLVWSANKARKRRKRSTRS
jgi:hypothetical protein